MDLLRMCYGCTKDVLRICYVFIIDLLRICYESTKDLLIDLLLIYYRLAMYFQMIYNEFAMDLLWIY